MHLASEYSTKPRILLTYNPRNNYSLQNISSNNLSEHNFNSVPDKTKLIEEYDKMLATLSDYVELKDVADLLNSKDLDLLNADPNSMFTRDSLVTLPWQPDIAVVPNMTLAARSTEPQIMKKAALKLGLKLLEPPQEVRFEGGDISAIAINGKRVLVVGIGSRTNMAAVNWLTEKLIPDDADEILAIRHNRKVLHLDTCFTILPNQTVVCTKPCIENGYIIGKDLQPKRIDPLAFFAAHSYSFISMPADQARLHEGCNMLFVGDKTYVAFKLPDNLADEIKQIAKINLVQLDGLEIAKANGGVHCLTRPIY